MEETLTQTPDNNVTTLQPAQDSPVARSQEAFGKVAMPEQIEQIKDALPTQSIDPPVNPEGYRGFTPEKVEELTAIATTPEQPAKLSVVPDARASQAASTEVDEQAIKDGINESLQNQAEHAANTNDVFNLEEIKEQAAQEDPASKPPFPDYTQPQPPAAN